MAQPPPDSNGDTGPASEFDCSDWLGSKPDMPEIDCRFEKFPSDLAWEFDCSSWGSDPEKASGK